MRISWLFNVDNTYYWSFENITHSTIPYLGLVDPSSFSGITESMTSTSTGLISSSDLTISVVASPPNLRGKLCYIKLLVDGVERKAWTYRVKRSEISYGKTSLWMESIIGSIVEGYHPTTKKPEEVWKTMKGVPNSSYVIPQVFGKAFIPLRSVYEESLDDRYYVLGDSAFTYTIDMVKSPKEWANQSTWDNTFSYPQNTLTDYKVFQALIWTYAGAEVYNGIWRSGDYFYDMPARITSTEISATQDVSPADVIYHVLKNFLTSVGLPESLLDAASFATAKTTYSSWGLAWNGGFYDQIPRDKRLSNLLLQANSVLKVTDKIYLYPISSTIAATFGKSQIKRSSYSYNPAWPEDVDGGYIEYIPDFDTPQDRPVEALVWSNSTQTSADDVIKPTTDRFNALYIHDSVLAQKMGILYYNKLYDKKGNINFSILPSITYLGIYPGQYVSVVDTIYGGTHEIQVSSITYNKDLSISFTGEEYVNGILGIEDLTPAAIVIPVDSEDYSYVDSFGQPYIPGSPYIQNIFLENSIGNGYDFNSRDCHIVWENPLGTSSSLDYYKVEIQTVGGATLHTEITRTTRYELTFEKNASLLEGPYRTFKVKVTAYKFDGTASAPLYLQVNNPQAGLVTGVAVVEKYSAAEIYWNSSTEQDVDGYYIYIGTTLNFTVGTPYASVGANTNNLYISRLGDGNYYVKVVAYDIYGKTSLNIPTNGVAFTIDSTLEAADLIGFPKEISQVYTAPVLEGDAWVNSLGTTLSWNSHSVWYEGQEIIIQAGNTTSPYIFWAGPSNTSYSTTTDVDTFKNIINTPHYYQIAINYGTAYELGWDSKSNMIVGNLKVGTAAIENAQIGNIIESPNFEVTPTSAAGWHINKNGAIIATDLEIYAPDGTLLIDGNTSTIAAKWSDVQDDGSKPQDNATVGAPTGTMVGGVLAETLVTTVNDIAADNKLTPVEKSEIRRQWDAAISEKSGINTTAALYPAAATANTNYNNTLQALGTYLNNGTAYTLSTTVPPSWINDANLGTTTSIVGSTFRATWKTFYDWRQALLNKISEEAGKVANWSTLNDMPVNLTSFTENATTKIMYPLGGAYGYNGAISGAIKITLPQNLSSNTMLQFEVDVYTYATDKSFKLIVSGYTYTDGWGHTSVRLIGSTLADNRVRFGADTSLSKAIILIGNTTADGAASSWSYPKVTVSNLQAGYGSFYDKQYWETGWSISIVNALTSLTFPQMSGHIVDYADALIDAASIKNQGAFATTDEINVSNYATFIKYLNADTVVAGGLRGINVNSSSHTCRGSYLTSAPASGATTLNVHNTADFNTSGSGYILDRLNDKDEFTWTGKTATTLTGCSGVLAHNANATIIPKAPNIVLDKLSQELRVYGYNTDANTYSTCDQLVTIGIKDFADGGASTDAAIARFGNETFSRGLAAYFENKHDSIQTVRIRNYSGNTSSSVSLIVQNLATDGVIYGNTGINTNGRYAIVAYGTVYDFYATGPGTNGPFTGSHDAYISKEAIYEVGDIVSDLEICYVRNISNTLSKVCITEYPKDKKVIGVVNNIAIESGVNTSNIINFSSFMQELAFSDLPATLYATIYEEVDCNNWESYATDFSTLIDNYNRTIVNAIGEGQINVVAEGGNIEAGDYICSSSTPGKGMKQDDDLLHNYTVAKARESVVWTEEEIATNAVKMVACTYHCG